MDYDKVGDEVEKVAEEKDLVVRYGGLNASSFKVRTWIGSDRNVHVRRERGQWAVQLRDGLTVEKSEEVDTLDEMKSAVDSATDELRK